ncbi:MAG: tetratricopeptide repeat protein [Candidatus Riflebacteria bacterium]|nr:tetratricopeptide repeat protein [Candidatus Riflebacteria bacterium]
MKKKIPQIHGFFKIPKSLFGKNFTKVLVPGFNVDWCAKNEHSFNKLFLVLFLLGIVCSSLSADNSPNVLKPKRFEIPTIGFLIIRNKDSEVGEEVSQLILEKTGAPSIVLATLDALEFVDVLKGDIDGDQIPEIIAVARNKSSDDLVPFIFSGKSSLKQIFPPNSDEFPVMGKEISLIPGPDGLCLGVKCLVNFHDFGPPEFFNLEYYRIKNGILKKVDERPLVGSHFNQIMNQATWNFQKGKYADSIQLYEKVLSEKSLPGKAREEILYYLGMSKKYQKNFSEALKFFESLITEFPTSQFSEEGKREIEFLNKNINATPSLSLYVDLLVLKQGGKLDQALEELRKIKPTLASDSVLPKFLLLEGEILLGQGKLEEAMTLFKDIKTRFPSSEIASQAETNLLELQGDINEEPGE